MWTYLSTVLFKQMSSQIQSAQDSTGFMIPKQSIHAMFDQMYSSSEADTVKQAFQCKSNGDCAEGLAHWVQATHWVCNTRWAFNGALKSNPSNFGPVYPMEFGMPTCEPDENGVNTKTCHCTEGDWIRGIEQESSLGVQMQQAFGTFYKERLFFPLG